MFCGSSACLIVRMMSTPWPSSCSQEADLALSDAVLAGAGSIHADRPHVEPRDELFRLRRFPSDRPASISTSTWKLPSPAWPTIGAISPISAMSASVCGDAFGKPRDRHADVGRQPLGARPQRQRRPIGVVPGLPQLRPLLGDAGPQERPAAIFCGDLAEGFGLLGNAGVAAMEFDEQARALRDSRVSNSSSSPASAAH